MFRLSAAAAALCVAAAPAFAGNLDQPAPEPMVQPVATPAPVMMGNDWSGFYAGGQLGYGKVESDIIPDDEVDGALYGVHAGYLYDFGSIVAGAELDVNGTNIEDEDTGIEVDRLAMAKLRLGYDAGSFMPYLTAGASQAKVSGGFDAEDTGRFGGLGVDYQFSNNLRVGAEVLKHQFDDFDDTGVDYEATTVAARMSFQF